MYINTYIRNNCEQFILEHISRYNSHSIGSIAAVFWSDLRFVCELSNHIIKIIIFVVSGLQSHYRYIYKTFAQVVYVVWLFFI